MGYENSVQFYSNQNPYDKWNAAYANYNQHKIDTEKGQTGYTPAVDPLSSNFFVNPTAIYTGGNGGYGSVADDRRPNIENFAQKTYYTNGEGAFEFTKTLIA
jgi:hypothetical protein